MKRLLVFLLLLAACGGAFYYSHRHQSQAHVGPEAVLNALAETQRDLGRVPAKLTRLSDAEEIRIGDGMASGYMASGYTTQSGKDAPEADAIAKTQQYVAQVGAMVASNARRKLPYRFHYIPDPSLINAFALPGGHVFIGGGLMHLMETEDELASVLGHEVEHVDHYHCNERVALETHLRNIPLGGLVALPIELFKAGYNKEQELEADRDGTALAVMAGYSPQGAIRMFQTFGKLHKKYIDQAGAPDEEMSRVALEGIQGYFRSHPLPEEREAQVKQLMATNNWPEPKERGIRMRP